MFLNINTDAVVKYTNTLEKMHRSALPSAIRGTLNKAVYDVKTVEMPKESKLDFVNRKENFFKANSKFENANGWRVDSMASTVGFFENKLANANTNYSVKDLEQQEHGGTIKKKQFIATESARSGKTNSGLVRPNARLKKIRKIIDTKHIQGVSDKQKFARAVSMAGVGGFVLSKWKGKEILWRVNSKNRTEDGQYKLTALYIYKRGRSIHVNATDFMRKSSFKTAFKMEGFYIKEAERQIAKLQHKY